MAHCMVLDNTRRIKWEPNYCNNGIEILYLFIGALFNNSVSNWAYIGSNHQMMVNNE
jgi:hypothetical protein